MIEFIYEWSKSIFQEIIEAFEKDEIIK